MKNEYQISKSGTLDRFDLNKKSKKKRSVEKKNNLLVNDAQIGYYLIAPLLIGVFLGLFIDTRMHTRPTFVIIFLILGVVATFYNLYRIVKN